MTASATTAARRSPTPLRDAAAALQDAEEGLVSGDSALAHEALRALARQSYRSLRERLPEPPTDG